MRAWVLLIACLFAPAQVVAAQPAHPPATFDRAALQADVDVLQEAYEALHPGLYRYNTPASMRAHFATLRKTLDGPRSLTETYLALSRFAATIRCGHTYPNFHNQPDAIQHALFERDDRVPFRFRWLGDAMVVTEDESGHASIKPGTRVLAIDGVPTARLLADMMAMARADGGNDAKRRALLEVQGTEKYETFDVYLSLLRPATGGTRRYRVLPPGATRPVAVELASQTHAQRLARRSTPDAGGSGPQWTLDLSDPALAVLRMPSWALYNSRWDWQGFLRDSFQRLERGRVPALVIDLRGNEGGLDVGDALLAHLLVEPGAFPEYRRLVRYRSVPVALAPYLDTWDPSFKDWGDAAQPHDARFFTLKRDGDTNADTIAPQAPRFAGPVYVLIGAGNSSATFEFAQRVRRSGVATLVGQPTGGNRRGINGGAFFFLRLPNTRLELDLPLIGQFARGDEPDAGLVPDVAVTLTIADLAAGRDVEMAAVRRLLEAGARHARR